MVCLKMKKAKVEIKINIVDFHELKAVLIRIEHAKLFKN